jgi:Lon protease-like protein
MTSAIDLSALALFPLQTVLFPGGLLSLKVFEARYLDLIGRCMRDQSPFGVVSLRRGAEVRSHPDQQVDLESRGVIAVVMDVDSLQPGILQVRCRGTQRFELRSTEQQLDGLWVGEAQLLDDDEWVAPGAALAGSVRGLVNAIATLRAQNSAPFFEPFRFDDAGWVANRWCEILPIPMAAKQKLMELEDPLVRLRLVDEFLRSKGVVS